MKGHGKDWVPREAVIGFLYVGCQTAQALALVVGTLDLVHQATPKVGSLVLSSVPVYVCIAPVVGEGQQMPGLQGTEAPVCHAKDCNWPARLRPKLPFRTCCTGFAKGWGQLPEGLSGILHPSL